MAEKPIVTISLLTWNGSKYLPWLLKSLKAQTFRKWELLVLDNASNDNSVEMVKEYCPQARIITQKRNVGFARGHNLIMNWSDSDYIFVLNQDIILDKDYLSKIVTFLDKNTKVASVAGKVMYWDFNSGAKTDVIDSFGLQIDKKREVSDIYQGKKDKDIESQEVFGLSGAAVVYRRKALDSVAITHDDGHKEYFDEDFFAYKEDVDLAWRLRLVGWQNWLLTTTKAYHHRTISKLRGIKKRKQSSSLANRLSYRNHLMTLYKNSFYSNLWKDFWAVKWYEFRKVIYLLLFERSTLGGIKEYFQSLPKLKEKRKLVKKTCQVNPEDIYKWFK